MTIEIENQINNQFSPQTREFVTKLIEEIYEKEWGVAKDQLALSLLKLANGSVDKLLSYFPIVDPRDIIMEANSSGS